MTANESVMTPIFEKIEQAENLLREIRLDHETRPSVVDFVEAARVGNAELICELLNRDVDVNVKNNYGNTALHWSAYHGNVHILRTLLRHGARVNEKNSVGNTPLHDSIKAHNLECMKLLLKYGADPSIKNNNGYIPQDFTSDRDIKILLEGYMLGKM